MVHVTRHAIERYQERVANLPDTAVIAALSAPAVECAARFGAPFVRLASGHRAVLSGDRVVTVLFRDILPQRLSPEATRKFVGRG